MLAGRNQEPAVASWVEYWTDAWQRSILCADVLRQRGNEHLEHNASVVPHVLTFKVELIRDGRTLPRPVNYLLARIIPPDDAAIDPAKPPFIVVDPRAGHGPGIGGMKQDSEIGVAIAAGHPCYFVGFLPDPVAGQTVEDVCLAEAEFVAEVVARHPEAAGKPVIVANCQAGWQMMMMAAMRPDLTGPLLLAGSPLSYWGGVRGKNPMRYLGGVLGGTWLTALAGDMGHGIFDGAYLVANFESMDLANTFWQKPYNVYSKVDTEAPRFLEFETWWGSPVLLNAGEMQWIADNLFVGNKLTAGTLKASDGTPIDLRRIRSPIVVFCSWADNITPPQQALGWITDLYGHERDIALNGQTIVYTLHQSIGHLGIFVSGKVATKEHRKLTGCMDMIALAPPGLYEAVITEVEEDTRNPELVDGRYLFRLEPRTLDDIRALGENSAHDNRRFAAAARVSEMNLALYRTLAAPVVQALATPAVAEATRACHPNRLRFSVFSDRDPMMQPVAALADWVRDNRQPVAPDNPFLAMERTMSSWITASLDAVGGVRDAMMEAMFLATYGSPMLGTVVGTETAGAQPDEHAARDQARAAADARHRADLEPRFEAGGPSDAALRALVYVLRGDGVFDEREFATMKLFRAAQPAEQRRSPDEIKAQLHEQTSLVRLDEERAVRSIPKLLPPSADQRRALLEAVQQVTLARGPMSKEAARRFARIRDLFDEAPSKAAATEIANA